MVLAKAYFDESGTHSGSKFLCVAGYIFEEAGAVGLNLEWAKMLAEFQIPYFHRAPSENGEPPFDRLDNTLRAALRNRAARIIRDHTTYAVAVSVNPDLYDDIMPRHALVGDAYTFCATGCFHAVKVWADTISYPGKVAFFFEAGAKSQKETDEIMRLKVVPAGSVESFRYSSHSFLTKKDAYHLQAADMLAWSWAVNFNRVMDGEDSRDDFAKLIDHRGMYWHWTPGQLAEQAEKLRLLILKNPLADPLSDGRSRSSSAEPSS